MATKRGHGTRLVPGLPCDESRLPARAQRQSSAVVSSGDLPSLLQPLAERLEPLDVARFLRLP
jgi:hypothetical protein